MTTVDGVAHPGVAATAPVDVLRQQAAAALTRAYRWLDRAVPAAPPVAMLVPGLVTAVSLYTAEQYQACLVQTGAVLQAVAGLRAAQPGLPEL
jgi:hypothetical protein